LIETNALVQLDGEPHIVQEVLSSGAGGPARAKLMNINSGKLVYKTWKTGTTLEYLAKESRPATYSYFDESESCFVFFDEAFEEFRVSSDILGGASKWLVNDVEVDLKLFDGRVIEFGFRGDVILKVMDFPRHVRSGYGGAAFDSPRLKNNQRSKRVLLSNGEVVRGPKYIQIGDRVVVDPGTCSILKRI